MSHCINRILNTILLFAILSACNPVRKTEWISTTNDNPWSSNQPLSLKNGTSAKAVVIIRTDQTRQAVDGFGGCFNELGWEALTILNHAEKDAIIKSLFDTITGCGFNICRMPIGANDYAVDWYSYNEMAEDFEMTSFNLQRDKQRLILYIKMAQQIRPDLAIWASPWSPPSWMKTNHHYACASNPKFNDLPADRQGKEMVTQFRMEPKVLNAYALYFEKFIKGYAMEGITISAIHVQNEMNSCQNFPSCIWRPEDMAIFIGQYLGPKFSADNVKTDIWLGTVERPQIGRVDTILGDPEAAKYIKGVGFQWAGKGAIAAVHQKYPAMKLMQTETECGDGSNDWAAAEHTFELMNHYFKNGANAYMYWNMVLNETGKSQWGWKQNSMITIDSKSKTVKYNPEFYLMKHLSAFVQPGAKYLSVEKGGENVLAFRNPGSVIILCNNPDNAREMTFQLDDQLFTVQLPAKSFNTFKIKM
jgi:glucosylceramidase